MKRVITVFTVFLLVVCSFTGCGADNSKINVMTREEGSGTRGAFIELFGIESKNESGEKIDNTTLMAETTNSTSVMITSVASDPTAIGYVSISSLNDSVRALQIDGADATVENIKNKTYKISRPFIVAVKDDISQTALDFLNFIMSDEGQKTVENSGYISQGGSGAYSGSSPSGSVTVAGSSSVTPVMEKLKEAYAAVNPNAKIIVQQSDSTTGITSVIDGVCDIAMTSRELSKSEISAGLKSITFATDGIAVIVNPQNPVTALTSEEVKAIYTGEKTAW